MVMVGLWFAPTASTLDTAHAAEPLTVKAFTYNILGSFSGSDGKCGEGTRVRTIAQYVHDNDIEVVFLQEAGCSRVLAAAWGKLAGTQIDYIETSYINKQLAILSKLPMERSSAGGIIREDSPVFAGDRRTQSVRIKKNNQYIRLFNIHPQNFCNSATPILSFIEKFNAENVPGIIGGDYNSGNGNIPVCVPDIDQRLVRDCTATGVCLGGIDHVWAKSSQSLVANVVEFKRHSKDGIFKGMSDHEPVEAVVRFEPRAADPAVRGDFNGDGVVTLLDHTLFTPVLHTSNSRFALTGTDGNYIDLYDYNELLKLLQ